MIRFFGAAFFFGIFFFIPWYPDILFSSLCRHARAGDVAGSDSQCTRKSVALLLLLKLESLNVLIQTGRKALVLLEPILHVRGRNFLGTLDDALQDVQAKLRI